MSEDRIKEIYDSNPNMTLQRLSQITGKTIADLKRILMS